MNGVDVALAMQVGSHRAVTPPGTRETVLGCSCGWRAVFTSADLRPSWQQFWAHVRAALVAPSRVPGEET